MEASCRTPVRPPAAASATLVLLAMVTLVGSSACSRDDNGHDAAHSDATSPVSEPWAVTAWGALYEIFPEVDPLVVGQTAESHTHVTALADFSPLTAGDVSVVLRGADGVEQSFRANEAKRPGIFAIQITPTSVGEFQLLFRVGAAAGREEIAGGRVRVGGAADPGGLVTPPPLTERAQRAATAAGGEEISFLKEQQWKTPFATEWALDGAISATRVAPARVVARPGGDRTGAECQRSGGCRIDLPRIRRRRFRKWRRPGSPGARRRQPTQERT